MKRLISLLTAVILISCVSICKSRAYEEYNLSDLANCSGIKSDSNSRGGYLCAFSGNTVFSAKLVPDFSSYNFTVYGHIKGVSQSGKYTYALVLEDTFTNKYSVYSLNTDNGNVFQSTFSNENFRTDSFSVSDNCIYYIKTDSAYAYVACVNLSSDKKTKITFGQNVNEVFNNNGKSYARLYDGSICKLSQTSSTRVANAGEFRNISNVGINKVINEDGFVVSLSDNSRVYVSNAEFGKVSASDNKVFSVVNYHLSRKTSDKTQSVSIPDTAKAVVSYKNQCGVLLDNGTVQVYESSDFDEKKTADNNNHSDLSNSDNQAVISDYIFSDGIIYGVYSGETVADFKAKTSADAVYKSDGSVAKSGKLKTGFTTVMNSKTYTIAVCGDVTGEGNVNSKDVTLLQKHLCGNAKLSGAFLKAADFNLDGKVDNRDLVLISRQKD
nr:dockerin type I repeat-containing protein [uncultured Ruminococcus sp.]